MNKYLSPGSAQGNADPAVIGVAVGTPACSQASARTELVRSGTPARRTATPEEERTPSDCSSHV